MLEHISLKNTFVNVFTKAMSGYQIISLEQKEYYDVARSKAYTILWGKALGKESFGRSKKLQDNMKLHLKGTVRVGGGFNLLWIVYSVF
jgi:hypothetical protein